MNISFMLIKDTVIVMLCFSAIYSLLKYMKKARERHNCCDENGRLKSHLRMHVLIMTGFLVSVLLGAVMAVLHLISQNILGWPPEIVLEYLLSVSVAGVLLTIKACAIHGISEETPSSTFYIGDRKK